MSTGSYRNETIGKKIPPLAIDVQTYRRLLALMAHYSQKELRPISIREVINTIIDEKYKILSGSINL